MASIAPSDTESNVSGFVQCSDRNFKHLYRSLIQNMDIISQELVEVERNLKNIVAKAGPMEGQLSVLLDALPKPVTEQTMETD